MLGGPSFHLNGLAINGVVYVSVDCVLFVLVLPGVCLVCLGGFGSEDWLCLVRFRFRVLICVPEGVLVVGLVHSRGDRCGLVVGKCEVIFVVFRWVLEPFFLVFGLSCLFGGLMRPRLEERCKSQARMPARSVANSSVSSL